jgi:hypothetical protein
MAYPDNPEVASSYSFQIYVFVYTFFHFDEVSVLLASLSHFLQLENDAVAEKRIDTWTNFSLQDKPWAEFSTLEVAVCIPCTYCPVQQYNLT